MFSAKMPSRNILYLGRLPIFSLCKISMAFLEGSSKVPKKPETNNPERLPMKKIKKINNVIKTTFVFLLNKYLKKKL